MEIAPIPAAFMVLIAFLVGFHYPKAPKYFRWNGNGLISLKGVHCIGYNPPRKEFYISYQGATQTLGDVEQVQAEALMKELEKLLNK